MQNTHISSNQNPIHKQLPEKSNSEQIKSTITKPGQITKKLKKKKSLLLISISLIIALLLFISASIIIVKSIKKQDEPISNNNNTSIVATSSSSSTTTSMSLTTTTMSNSTSSTTTTSIPVPGPYDNWNTYTNSRYNYTLRYPDGWIIDVFEVYECPPMVDGCTTVEHEGDIVEIAKEGGASGIRIKVDNSIDTNMEGSCLILTTGENIDIDGEEFITFYDSDSAIYTIGKDYKTLDSGGSSFLCPYPFWKINGNTYHIAAAPMIGISTEDNETIIAILESLDF